ncbi:MAG TPA: MFS transporter [Propionibacteriaceae bacterium]
MSASTPADATSGVGPSLDDSGECHGARRSDGRSALTLAEIMRSYDVGSQKAQWVLNASLVTLAALLVLGGQLGDMLGRRRVFVFGTIVFATASACAAFAPTFNLLILCRAVQGAGGAFMWRW